MVTMGIDKNNIFKQFTQPKNLYNRLGNIDIPPATKLSPVTDISAAEWIVKVCKKNPGKNPLLYNGIFKLIQILPF